MDQSRIAPESIAPVESSARFTSMARSLASASTPSTPTKPILAISADSPIKRVSSPVSGLMIAKAKAPSITEKPALELPVRSAWVKSPLIPAKKRA